MLTEVRGAGQRADQVVWLTVHAPAVCKGVEILIVFLPTGRCLIRIRIEFMRGEGGGVETGAVGVTVEVSHWLLRAKDKQRWVGEGTAIQLSVA